MVSLRAASISASVLMLVSGVGAIATQPFALPFASAQPGMSAITAPANHSVPIAQTPQSNPAPSRLLTRRIQRDLAQRLNVAPSSLQIIEATVQTWPDQCLGLARYNERCMGPAVRGWQVQIASSQQMWTYRSDRIGRKLRLEPLAGTPDFGPADFSIEASQNLLTAVAQQVQQPIANLKVLEVQPATWNGCLGIFEPDQACTMIAIAGFRVIVSNGQTSWVYHLSGDGTQVAQNATASGASSSVSTLFSPIDAEPSIDFESQIIFQSQLSGDLAGSVNITALTADGTLYREQSSLGATPGLTRTVIRQLTATEVADFQRVLSQQRFPNLNRMRYLTDAAFADYPTTRLESPGLSTEYIDLEVDSLPNSLKAIISAWEALL